MKKLTAVIAALIMLSGCAGQKTDDSSEKTVTKTETETTETETVTTAETVTTIEAVTSVDSSSAEDTSSDIEEAKKKEFDPLYDITPMLDAFRSGDRSRLDEFETEALEKAERVISEVVTEDMDDYQKELAVHDWLIAECTYDPGELRVIPKRTEHSDEPYGALVLGKAICAGYSTSFQLMMSMLGIPCVLIHSTDVENEEHAWNAVQLDGAWYYVDVTWDDPVPDKTGRAITHEWFNVSYDFLSERHVMTEDCPQTESFANSFEIREATELESIEQLADAVNNAVSRNYDTAVLHITDSSVIEGKYRLTKEWMFWNEDVVALLKEGTGRSRNPVVRSKLTKIDDEEYVVLYIN